MIRNDQILDELFRSRLDDFEEVPSSDVWMKIREKQKAGQRRRVRGILRTAGIAAAVLLAFLTGWQLREHRQRLPETQVVVAKEEQKGQDLFPVSREKSGNKQEMVAEPATAEKKTLPDAYPVKQEEKEPDAVSDKHLQNASEPAGSKTIKLLTMADVHLETPAFPGGLTNRASGNRDTRNALTETDLRIVEMNRQVHERNKPAKNDESWSVGAMVSPAFSVNQRSYEATYAGNMSRPGGKQQMTIGGGISVGYKTGKRWSIQSGLYYSRLGQSSGTYGNNRSLAVDHSFEYTYSDNRAQMEAGKLLMNASAGVVEINQLPSTVRVSGLLESVDAGSDLRLTNDNFDQRFEYLEIPLLLRYRLVDRAWNMEMLGGVSANMLVGNQAYLKEGGRKTPVGETKDMNPVNYSASVGIGLGYPLTGKIRLNIEPQLKYYLQSLNKNPDVTFKPYSIGVYTGLSYRF
ncbi:MAG: outer membrane beta-barrel protein [Mangrovibacterium sp.]|nr:outer membrane beta-barrel protein [Mangrovibacterium sp.]